MTILIHLRLVDYFENNLPQMLTIELDSNAAVDQWLTRFKFELDSGAMLKKEHIFMGQSVLTLEQMIFKINQTLDTISNWDFVGNSSSEKPVHVQPNISVRIKIEDFALGPNNELMNTVHNYFPLLSGPAHRTSNYMYAASPEIRANICRLNLEVHELHTLLQNHQHAGMHLNISWQRAPKNLSELTSVWDGMFNKHVQFGDVFLGYPQVGKTHFEAFIEDDTKLDEEHVEPIKLLSGDMLLHLSSSIGKETIKQFDSWLIERGLDPDDVSNRYGFARLGRVVNITPESVATIVGKYNDIDQIIVDINGEQTIYNYKYSRFNSNYDKIWLEHIDD
jgi:hypothetical protein